VNNSSSNLYSNRLGFFGIRVILTRSLELKISSEDSLELER